MMIEKLIGYCCEQEMVDKANAELRELKSANAENERLRTGIARLSEWTWTFGAELKPPGADTYGEGVRDSKARVARIIEAALSSGAPPKDGT